MAEIAEKKDNVSEKDYLKAKKEVLNNLSE